MIGVIGANRSAAAPDVPTLAEQGFGDDIYKIVAPFSLLAPAKTPAAVIDRLGAESSAIVKSAEMTRLLLEMGMEPIGNLPAAADAAYRERLPVMLSAVRNTGVTLD